MDSELELIALCEKIINAGTSEPGTWAMSQKTLVRYCRELLNRLGAAKVGGRQRQVLNSLEDAFTSKIGDAKKCVLCDGAGVTGPSLLPCICRMG